MKDGTEIKVNVERMYREQRILDDRPDVTANRKRQSSSNRPDVCGHYPIHTDSMSAVGDFLIIPLYYVRPRSPSDDVQTTSWQSSLHHSLDATENAKNSRKKLVVSVRPVKVQCKGFVLRVIIASRVRSRVVTSIASFFGSISSVVEQVSLLYLSGKNEILKPGKEGKETGKLGIKVYRTSAIDTSITS